MHPPQSKATTLLDCRKENKKSLEDPLYFFLMDHDVLHVSLDGLLV
jgi:hypothetical protein